jgi:nitrate/TMAO reductase-like tetraheme cytochrome c subunit
MGDTNKRPVWFVVSRHWLSLLGLTLLATALISTLFVLPQQIHGHENPYLGIIILLVLPILFFAGLAFVPIGIYLSKRRIREGMTEAAFDRRAALHRLAWFFGVVTIVNVLIGTQITYRGVKYMETPNFCGGSCHVMSPEFAAYQHSPHSKVECVECHVAPGQAGWIRAKTSGIRQLFETVLNTYPKPIPSAIESNRLVSATETCENCHSAQKSAGVRLRILSKYADDEANTRTETVLLMLVGGSRTSGIHSAHFGPGVHIRFAAADAARQTIPWVEYRNTNTGAVRTFAGSDPPATKDLPTFEMQCVDCHNRPAHTLELPERAMDRALAFGDIPATLPFIKKEAVQLLKATYPTTTDATEKLPSALASFYQQTYPDIYSKRQEDIHQAGRAVLAIYQRNVFPELKVSWGTYPNNLGHTDFPGCFRCHDGSHVATDGTAISQDCSSCHEPLAMDEASPEILKTLGIAERVQKLQKE